MDAIRNPVRLSNKTRCVSNPSGDVHFLFNTDCGTWTAMNRKVYEYINAVDTDDGDPYALGEGMGFGAEELDKFFNQLSELSLLYNAEVSPPAKTLSKCYFHITQACNLSCPTCYSWRAHRNEGAGGLSMALIGKALRQMRDLGLSHLVISGGEPLLHPDLIEILRVAKEECRIEMVVLLTNGTRIDEQNAKGIAQYTDVVCVSLDGVTEEENAAIRGRGNWIKAINSIKILRSAGVKKVNLLPTITHRNVHHMSEFIKLADTVGASISFSMFVSVGAGTTADDLSLTTEDMLAVAEIIGKTGRPQAGMVPLDCSVGLASIASCGLGRQLISLDYDGTVYPCHMTMRPELRMGKFPDQSVESILTGSPLAAYFRDFNVDRYAGCGGCFVRYFCGGGCRASAYSASGDLLGSDPGCKFYKPALLEMLEPILGSGQK